MGLGGTYSSALEDWLLTRHKPSANSVNNHFQLCDSVPDLSGFNENNCMMSISTNHSAPRKIPLNNNSRYSSNANHNYPLMQNHSYTNMHSSYANGYCGSPLRLQNGQFTNGNGIKATVAAAAAAAAAATANNNNNDNINNNITTKNAVNGDYDNDDNEVQLRRNVINRNVRCENGNEKDEWLYRRPTAPNDIRHSSE